MYGQSSASNLTSNSKSLMGPFECKLFAIFFVEPVMNVSQLDTGAKRQRQNLFDSCFPLVGGYSFRQHPDAL